MSRFKFAEEFCRRPDPAFAGVFEALSNAFPRVGLRSDIKQTLIGLRILDDRGSFAVDGQDHWPLGLFDLLQKLGGFPAESGKRLNVAWDVEHDKV